MPGGYQPYKRGKYRPVTAALKSMRRGRARYGRSQGDYNKAALKKRRRRRRRIRR